jgi:hypothetical protein
MGQEIHENDKEAQNKTMFAISDVKAHFDLGNTKTIHHLHTTKGTFDLENRNVYDSVTNKILKVGLQIVYDTEFVSRLGRLAILKVQPFLNHHYKASENKEQFIEYLEFDVLYHVYIKDEGLKARIKDWISKQKQTPNHQTLSDLITNEKSEIIIEKIQVKYKNIKGKRLKLLLLAFQDLELLPKERIAKAFHDCCKNEFNWNIASYNAMNDYKFNESTDSIELNDMKKYINSFL